MSAPDSFSIVLQDDELIVIDKGPGVVVHPGRGHYEDTLSQRLAPLLAGGEAERAGIVHRLDRDTSGLLVVARTEEAHRRLQAAIAERRVLREYLALVEGRPPARTGTIEAPIGRDPRVRTRMTVGGAGAREAAHPFHARARRWRASRCCGCAWTPAAPTRSGSTWTRSDTPCAATRTTGGRGVLGLERQFLHATHLAFEHPFSGEQVDLESALPEDLRAALERAEKLS